MQVNELCKENSVEFSPGMLASILDLMIRTKNLSDAEQTYTQLKKLYPAFAVDEFKVIDLAALMIENDGIANARKILEVRAKSKLKGGTHCQKNIWALLSNVAAYSAKNGSSVNQSREFLRFLIDLGYCNYNNQLLGPIIKEHLLKNEITNALAEFEVVAEKHKKAPMHFELMTKLIEISNSKVEATISPAQAKELLAKLTGIVTSIHGSKNANVSLVVAFAKAGTDGQLRKILMDPKFELNAELLVKQCEYLSATGAEAALFKLAKCGRGLVRISATFKEEDLYNLLLNEYAKENDFTSALALFERIVEDEEARISIDFTRKVADLFEKNNLELPSLLQMHLRRS